MTLCLLNTWQQNGWGAAWFRFCHQSLRFPKRMSYLELKCASHMQYLVVMLTRVKIKQQNFYGRGPEGSRFMLDTNFRVSTCLHCILTQDDRVGNVFTEPTKLSCHPFKFIFQYMNCDSWGLQFMIFIDGDILSCYKTVTWGFEADLKTTGWSNFFSQRDMVI